MNEREEATFQKIKKQESWVLDEESLVEYASQDIDLCEALRARHIARQDIVRRMYRIASGDWSDETYHDTMVQIALDAVILRFQLEPYQVQRVLMAAQVLAIQYLHNNE